MNTSPKTEEMLFLVPENKRIIELLFKEWRDSIIEHHKKIEEKATAFGRDTTIHICPNLSCEYILDCDYEYAVFYKIWNIPNVDTLIRPTLIIDVTTLQIMICYGYGYLKSLPETRFLEFVDENVILTESTIPSLIGKNGIIKESEFVTK